jgi:O-antigen/teichoic acid export membrane protein
MFLAGTLLAVVVVLILFVILSPGDRDIRISTPTGPERGQVAALVRTYGLPFAILSVLSWIGNLSERYVLAGALGVAAVGIYAASFGIASRAQLLLGGIGVTAFRPALFEAESNGDSARGRLLYRSWMMATAAFSGAVVLFFWFLAPLIAHYLLAEEYRVGVQSLMTWVAAGYAFQNVNQVVENRIMSLGNSTKLIRPMIIGASGNLILALLLIPIVGLTGAAMASATSFLLQLFATLWSLRALRLSGKANLDREATDPYTCEGLS